VGQAFLVLGGIGSIVGLGVGFAMYGIVGAFIGMCLATFVALKLCGY
jgi:hypothetical protein